MTIFAANDGTAQFSWLAQKAADLKVVGPILGDRKHHISSSALRMVSFVDEEAITGLLNPIEVEVLYWGHPAD